MSVNIVRLPGAASTDSVASLLAARRAANAESGDAFAQMAATVFGSADKDKDRALERMALIARLLGDQENMAISREQLAEQARQFNETLNKQQGQFEKQLEHERSEGAAQRELTSRQIGTMEGQLEELKKSSSFERKSQAAQTMLAQSGLAVQAAFSEIDAASQLAGMDVKDRVDGVRKSMEQSIHSDFAPFSREIQLLAASVPADDEVKKTALIGQVDSQVSGFERMFKDRLADAGAKPEVRAAAVIAANNYVQEMLGEIGKLHAVAGRADKKKLEAMQDRLVDVARNAVRATGVIQQLDQALSIDEPTKAIAREKLRRTRDLAKAATAFRSEVVGAASKEDAILPEKGLDAAGYAEPIGTPSLDLSGVNKALEKLTVKPVTTTSGFAVPDAKVKIGGEQVSPRIAQLVLERAQAEKAGDQAASARREASNEQFAQAQERASIGDIGAATGLQVQSILSGLLGGAMDTGRQMRKDIGGLFTTAAQIEQPPPKPTTSADESAIARKNLAATDKEDITLITPDGRIAVMSKVNATPSVIASYKAAGYRIPGLDGG